jgi:PTH1 family peptidyl-tRNA hydrolase
LWLVVGLGNPGRKYARTRHNVGFIVLEDLAENSGLTFKERKEYRICDGSIENNRIVLLEPLTFMNRSGTAVRKIADKFSISPEEIIVVHDDLDLDVGRLKIRKKGSAGGHRGIASVIDRIGSKEFIRVRIGIGRDERMLPEDFVLSKFKRNELSHMRTAVKSASESIHTIITEGVDRAMNQFNTRRS